MRGGRRRPIRGGIDRARSMDTTPPWVSSLLSAGSRIESQTVRPRPTMSSREPARSRVRRYDAANSRLDRSARRRPEKRFVGRPGWLVSMPMELRHLRYFVAVAEEGSVTAAAEQRLHTAQPSLSRQIRDLEQEVGTPLMMRGPRGVELTAAGRAFLDHARGALFQAEAAVEAARRAAAPGKAALVVGFLTGYEMEWLAPLMALLRDQLPTLAVTIVSRQSPELAAGLMRGQIDLAFLRPEAEAPGLVYRLLRREPLVVLLRVDHALAAREAIAPRDLAEQVLVGVPRSNSPVLRAVTDAYGRQVGIDLTPDHEALNLAMAISLVGSTGGVSLLPLYARSMLPPALVSRPLEGSSPTIDLVLGHNEANSSPLLRMLIAEIEDMSIGETRPPDGVPGL